MIKVKVPARNSRLVVHVVVTLLATAVDLIDQVGPFQIHSRSSEPFSEEAN